MIAVVCVISLSLLCQLAATILAFRLLKVAGKHLAWILIASAMAVQLGRRILALWDLSTGRVAAQQIAAAETLGLILSALMVLGVASIGPFFAALQSSIAQRERDQAARRDSEEKYRTMVEKLNDIIYIAGTDGIISFVNPAAKRILGYAPEEVVGRQLLDFVYPPDRAQVEQRVRRVLEGPVKSEEFRLKSRDGSPRWVLSSTQPIFMSGKTIVGLEGVLTDITERKRVEEGLKKSELMIKGILDASPVGINLTVDRKIKWVNDAWVRIFGFTNEREYIDQPTGILYPSEQDYEETRSRIYKHLQEAHIGELIAVMMRHDGTVFHASLQICEVDPSDPSKGTISIIADISQRVEAEEALRKSEEQYRSLTENINLGIYRNTPGPEGRFIEANPALIGMFGYKNKEEFLAISVSSLYQNPEDRNRFNDKILEEGFVRGEELWLKKKDGTLFIGSVSAVAVKDKQGHVEYYDGIIEDVTERKRAEETLTDSETRFRIAARSASDLIYDWDILNGTLQWFGSVDALLGYAPGEFPRTLKAWEGILHTDDHDRVMAAVDQHLKKHVPYFEEYRVRRQDGTFGYWTDKGEALWDEKGSAYKMIGACTDITERKRMEEALREKEERYRQLVDNTDTGFVVIDDKGIVIMANEPYQRIAGAKGAEDVIGHSVIEWTAPEEQENNAEAVALCARQGFIKDFETVYQHGDGTRVHLLINATVHESSAGGKDIVSFCRDITERKQAEEEFKNSELRYRSLFDCSSDILVQIDPSGTIVDLNKNAEAIGGYKKEEIVGRKIGALAGKFSVPSLALMVGNFAKRKLGLQVGAYEVEAISSAGQRLFFEVNTVPVKDSAGKETGELAILHDITERKRAEEELGQHRRNLERLVQERTADLNAARAAALNLMQDAELQRLETERALAESKRMGTALKDSEEELRKHAEELESFNRAMVDREGKIIEMKEEINRLCRELGRPPAYPPIWDEKSGGKTRG